MAARPVLRRIKETRVGHDPAICVPDLFLAWVAEAPERSAVCLGQYSLSYEQLNREASCLSLQLKAADVGHEDVVAICLDRSPEFVAAALATWKAGGAYLPLDPAYPAEHLEELLRDSRAKALVTRPAISSKLRFDQQAIYVHQGWPGGGQL